MTAFHARRDEDVAKLRELEKKTGGKIRVLKVNGSPISEISLRYFVRTAKDDKYPNASITEVDAAIQLGSRYPFDAPTVTLSTKVFNPNVYTSGKVCLGNKWIATEYLDLLAVRLYKILSFEESIINTSSAANGEAARWYIKAQSSHPGSFPSETLQFPDSSAASPLKWTDKSKTQTSTAPSAVIVSCPKCRTKLRLPAGRSGSVSCPACKTPFSVTT
jgi:LSD1 subclass zinc finger protein